MDEDALTRWLVGFIRAQMAQQGLGYADLQQRLAAVGVEENERNLRNKVMRGTFNAAFWIQCLVALGVRSIPLEPGVMGFTGQASLPERIEDHSKSEIIAEIYKVLGTEDGPETSTGK